MSLGEIFDRVDFESESDESAIALEQFD